MALYHIGQSAGQLSKSNSLPTIVRLRTQKIQAKIDMSDNFYLRGTKGKEAHQKKAKQKTKQKTRRL